MARLYEDGFDHYGVNETFMLDNVWVNADNNRAELSTTQFATGTHSIFFKDTGFATWPLRRVLSASKTKMGAAARFYFPTLPSGDNAGFQCCIFALCSSTSSTAQLAFIVDDNGRIKVIRGAGDTTGGTTIITTDPLIGAATWNHIEIQANISDTAGWVRIAVNGVHRYASATNIDTQHDSSGIVSVAHGQRYSPITGVDKTFYMDDLYVYDFVGSSATDTDFVPATDGSGVATNYIGELQCMWLPPNGDTVEADWLKSSGTVGYSLIDEVNPDDTDYVYSTTAGDLSEFALTDLPPEITYVRGLTVWGRMSKSDAGATMNKFGMKSVAATSDSAEFPITVAPAYWTAQINVDPNSSARWTRASLNAAWVRLIRNT